ncbi:MAG: peptide-methionine (R)-S-oxide reductase [Chitinophagaceae bacterium]|nr:peptide-methionine (R)-S-oxide reductase [Chitinophagaceae bacterium]
MGTGCPNFRKPENNSCVLQQEDSTYGIEPAKGTCSRCGAHLWYVFNDVPKPTGLQYCMNSVLLIFEKKNYPGTQYQICLLLDSYNGSYTAVACAECITEFTIVYDRRVSVIFSFIKFTDDGCRCFTFTPKYFTCLWFLRKLNY